MMTISINQILVFLLILVLVALIVVLAIMAVHAIDLMKRIKVLTKAGENAVEEIKGKADRIEATALSAVNSVAADTTPVTKALGVIVAGLLVLNFGSLIQSYIIRRGGTLAVIAANMERIKTKKEVKRARKAVRKVKKQTRLRKKAEHKMKKLERKARRQEKREERKAAKAV